MQFFDADTLAGEAHLFFATLNALKSFTQGRGIAQSLDIEILLYASAQKQIGEAIRLVGLQPQTSKMAVVIVGNDEPDTVIATQRLEPLVPGIQDESIFSKIDSKKMKFLKHLYGIDVPELETLSSINEKNALQWLIVERTALLDARR